MTSEGSFFEIFVGKFASGLKAIATILFAFVTIVVVVTFAVWPLFAVMWTEKGLNPGMVWLYILAGKDLPVTSGRVWIGIGVWLLCSLPLSYAIISSILEVRSDDE